MHTFKGKSCVIHYNSDISGDITITDKMTDYEDGTTIKINGDDILKFVSEYIRSQRIAEIEKMGWIEFLK